MEPDSDPRPAPHGAAMTTATRSAGFGAGPGPMLLMLEVVLSQLGAGCERPFQATKFFFIDRTTSASAAKAFGAALAPPGP